MGVIFHLLVVLVCFSEAFVLLSSKKDRLGGFAGS